MGEARGHHFISQCYLKRFTHNGCKNSKLWVYDLNAGCGFHTAPANVAKLRDFNLIEGLRHGELEGRLSGFESVVNEALNVIERDRSLTDADAWLHVQNLAALFAVRNPRMRGSMQDAQERIIKKVTDLMLSTREIWESQVKQAVEAGAMKPNQNVTYEQAKDFHERGQYTIHIANAHHIATEFHVFEPVLRTMVGRQWTLFLAESDSSFITSDHPVCLMPMGPYTTGAMRSVGYGMTETMVYFPITRGIAAMGAFEGGGSVVNATREKVAQFNTLLMHHANRQVFAPDGKAPVIGKSGSVVSLGEAMDTNPARRNKR